MFNFPLRLPSDVKAFIEAEARENTSSQNSEIVRAIRAAMKSKGITSTLETQKADAAA
nr:Arc family DNA-binding protein [Brucella anthropi]